MKKHDYNHNKRVARESVEDLIAGGILCQRCERHMSHSPSTGWGLGRPTTCTACLKQVDRRQRFTIRCGKGCQVFWWSFIAVWVSIFAHTIFYYTEM